MSDGVVLRANVFYPTDPKTGEAARGPFPVIMVQTPYGKDLVGSASGQEGGAEPGSKAGKMRTLLNRGSFDGAARAAATGDSAGRSTCPAPAQHAAASSRA